jgi:hypothetical protein
MDKINFNFDHFKTSPYYKKLFHAHRIFQDSDQWHFTDLIPRLTELPILNRSHLEPDNIQQFISFSKRKSLAPVWSNSDDEARFWEKIKESFSELNLKKLQVLFLCALEKGSEYTLIKKIKGTVVSIRRVNIFTDSELKLADFKPDIITTSPKGLQWLMEHPKVLHEKNIALVYSTALPLTKKLNQEFQQNFKTQLLFNHGNWPYWFSLLLIPEISCLPRHLCRIG